MLALDLDHTLVPDRTHTISSEYRASLEELKASGFRLILASNTRHDIMDLAASLAAVVIPATIYTRKPMRRYYQRVIETAGCQPNEIAMVGDRIINDILGAKRAGLITVKVDPIGRHRSPFQGLYDAKAAAFLSRRNEIAPQRDEHEEAS